MSNNKPQHTPIPWKAQRFPGQDDYTIWAPGATIARVPLRDVSINEQKANAEIIVRAVNSHAELLAAAKEVMDTLRDHGPGIVPHLMDTDQNCGERLRQAIINATT